VQVYADARGVFHLRELGVVHNSRKSEHDERTLDDVRFVTGDYLDVAIHFHPGRASGGAPDPRRGSASTGGAGGAGRDRDRDRDRERDRR
jgi:hypothetical protein